MKILGGEGEGDDAVYPSIASSCFGVFPPALIARVLADAAHIRGVCSRVCVSVGKLAVVLWKMRGGFGLVELESRGFGYWGRDLGIFLSRVCGCLGVSGGPQVVGYRVQMFHLASGEGPSQVWEGGGG